MVFDLGSCSLCRLSNLTGKKAFSCSFFFNPCHLSQPWQVLLGVLPSLRSLILNLGRAGLGASLHTGCCSLGGEDHLVIYFNDLGLDLVKGFPNHN